MNASAWGMGGAHPGGKYLPRTFTAVPPSIRWSSSPLPDDPDAEDKELNSHLTGRTMFFNEKRKSDTDSSFSTKS